ncbi:MAG TPA: site-2 protease family protein [Candidatus Binatia bacterium]|nr:site-2 protease family protein [Candidatus Binatia bacterium]
MAGFLIAVLAFLVVVTIVVLVHEGGHFLLARLSGIGVEEFAVGFGPRLASIHRGETVYSIRALPVGGFVKMPGMIGLEGETDMGPRNFNRATLPRRAATLVAGVAFNLIFGALCLSVVAAQPTDSVVTPDNPAAAAGIKSGDVVISEAGKTIDYSSQQASTASFQAADAASQGRPVPIVYRTPDGRTHTSTVTPELMLFPNVSSGNFGSLLRGPGVDLVVTGIDGSPPGTGDPAAVLGGGGAVEVSGHVYGDPTDTFSKVAVSEVRDGDGSQSGYTAAWRVGYGAGQPGAPWSQALVIGFEQIPAYLGNTASAIGELFTQPAQGAANFSGPVGIAAAAGSAVQQGWVQFLSFIGLISLALGFVNVLPIPFLDGGRLLFVGIEAVRRRQIRPQRQAVAILVSLAFLILLVVLVTINDIGHLSSGGPP